MQNKVARLLLAGATWSYRITLALLAILAVGLAISWLGGYEEETTKLLKSFGELVDSLVVFMVIIMWLERR